VQQAGVVVGTGVSRVRASDCCNGSRAACLAMVFKLAQSAEKRWRRLNGHQLIPDVIRGIRFIDGIKKVAA